MQPIDSIQIHTAEGKKPVTTYHRWIREVANGRSVEFALTVDPRRKDAITVTEISTGFSTGVVILHPERKTELKLSQLQGMRASLCKRAAVNATNAMIRKLGAAKFLRAVDEATFQAMMTQYRTIAPVAGAGEADKGASDQLAAIAEVVGHPDVEALRVRLEKGLGKSGFSQSNQDGFSKALEAQLKEAE